MDNLIKYLKQENSNSLNLYQFEQYELDILKKSEEDIKYGRVISQEDLDKEDLEWLSQI
ncbi:hypothetical protein SAMN05444387_3775 [Flavobacterium pectinovorum]|uniref:Uncharacterized protein n=1 Tax=Flavobacterium pectinovorum TaxID=29533 RepID=A0ABY1J7E8_9FLAO|nr:hypothetical protein [Flavobacterium pectinovorum]SHN00741.1 hypothetical protein SAMN05444387_3775 [Flavobacterium pectinovorum]